MDKWDRIIEEKIQEAKAQGKFDNLRGHGKPLRLDDEPDEASEVWTAQHLMKANGFRPDWLEADVELRQKLEAARAALTRARDWRQAELAGLGTRADPQAHRQRAFIADEWRRAGERFTAALREINQGITHLNLKVPHPRFQRRKLDSEEELRRLLA